MIGFYQYENTAKGEAMGAKDYFVKAVVQRSSMRILGAQIVGPHASILIQEIVNVMYTPEQSASVVNQAMHIHPALSEVVQRAFSRSCPLATTITCLVTSDSRPTRTTTTTSSAHSRGAGPHPRRASRS